MPGTDGTAYNYNGAAMRGSGVILKDKQKQSAGLPRRLMVVVVLAIALCAGLGTALAVGRARVADAYASPTSPYRCFEEMCTRDQDSMDTVCKCINNKAYDCKKNCTK